MRPPDVFRQDFRDGDRPNLPDLLVRRQGNGVGQQHFLDHGIVELLYRVPGQHGMGGEGIHLQRPESLQDFRRFRDAAGGVDHVIDEEAGLPLDVSYHMLHRGHVVVLPPLVHDRDRHPQYLGKRPRARGPSRIRGDNDRVLGLLVHDVLGEERQQVKVVARDIEEALDLRDVQLEEDDAVDARHLDHVRHQLGRDGLPGLGLLVLPGISVVGDDGRDA